MNTDSKHPTRDTQHPDRFAYVLHLWRSAGQWRASLENLETGKRLGFSALEQLFAHLIDLIEGNLTKQINTENERIEEAEKGN